MARIQLAAGYFVGLLLSASLLATCDAGFLVEPGAGADRLEVAGVSGLEVERDVVRVTAVVRDGAGLAISAGAVSWSSSDPAVVAIEAVTHREAELKALGPGVATITASYDDIAVFEFVEIQNRAVSLVPVSGSGQYAAPGALLPESLVVAIMDRHGAPVSGIDITFAVAEGGGAIFPATAQTDGAGRARAAWTLGSEGDQLARASAVPGQRRAQLLTDEAVAFAASVQLVAASITFEGAGGFDAEGDTVRLTAAVRDGQDRPITAGSVTWASSDPAVATVEPAGAREAVLVAHAPGTATITASYDDHAAAESVAVQNRANKLVRISGSGQSAPGGDRLPDALIAAVTDRKGDPVAGIDINFSVQSGGGSLSHPTARTDAAGEARTWWTIGTQGEQVVKARAAAGQKRAGPISNQVIEYEATVHDPPPPPLGTLTVSPSGHRFAAIGEELLLSVEARAADGQILGDAEVTWASSNSEVASVDSNGRVIARGIGAAMIAASAVCCTSTFVPIDVDEPSADPGRVTDLTATEVTTSTATLSFTQVDDGTGAPAQYLLRYRQAPYAHWGTANPVEAGSCAGSVAGTAVGQPLTCTVGGLEPGTSYGFQVIAFRGTFPGEAVFGELSDVTTASTQAADDGGPGSLTVTPSSHTFTAVGQELQLSVTARASNGDIIENPAITWTSSHPGVATVNSSGRVVAHGLGSAFIVASAVCCAADSAWVTVSDSSGKGWRANEPSGFVMIRESAADEVNNAHFGLANPSTAVNFEIVQDPTAPVSPPNVIRTLYPVWNNANGTYNAGNWHSSPPPGTREVYVTFAARVSPNWQEQDPGMKFLHFMWPGLNIHLDRFANDPSWVENYGFMAGQWGLGPSGWGQQDVWPTGNNVNAGAARHKVGEYQIVEIHFRQSSTGSTTDGLLRMWVDGVLVKEHVNLNVPSVGDLFMIGFGHVYGGGTRSIPEAQYVYIDHVYVSRPAN
jgi:uncharacterized protein YjdB